MSLAQFADGRRSDWARHIQDLVTGTYEGASERPAREAIFTRAFELVTPVAQRVLAKIDEVYLAGTGAITVTPPERDASNGLLGSWNLSWPLLDEARNRFTSEPLPPVQLFAMFPSEFSHGHIALFDLHQPRRWIACWPLQVTGVGDAERQELTLWTIAEAEVHERTFAADLNWRLLPMAEVASFVRT